MITDHSSAGFEFLLRDRPIVRIHRPELIREANIHEDYVNLLASVSASVTSVDEAVRAVERGWRRPTRSARPAAPWPPTSSIAPAAPPARAIRGLYEAIELDPSAALVTEEATCRP